MASRKLQSYVQAHNIEVLTNYLLRQVLQKLEALGRILKWATKLIQFDRRYKPRTAIKGRGLVDFMVEFTRTDQDYDQKDLKSSHKSRTYPHGVFMSMGS